MHGFTSMQGWQGRDPYRAGALGRPSMAALGRMQGRQKVSPGQLPFGDEEMELAFGQQAQEAQSRIATYQQGPKYDATRGGVQSDPTLERDIGNAIGGGWTPYFDALDRSSIMANNRGFNSRQDLVGRGPGSGTGVGRWSAQTGSAGPTGAFNASSPTIDIEDLMSDASGRSTRGAQSGQALRALQSLMRGR